MGSEMQPGIMKAQKREILISHVKKNCFQYGTGSLFVQLFSKLILKLVIRLMNRKSSCGYATHFFVIVIFWILL
jgi:hypothetical protein